MKDIYSANDESLRPWVLASIVTGKFGTLTRCRASSSQLDRKVSRHADELVKTLKTKERFDTTVIHLDDHARVERTDWVTHRSLLKGRRSVVSMRTNRENRPG